MNDNRQLYLRRTNQNPPAYRVLYDGVEVGSISETRGHVTRITFWQWGIDTMPLMDHGGRATQRSGADPGRRQKPRSGRPSWSGWTISQPVSGRAIATTRKRE
jgi:hypothetical protein